MAAAGSVTSICYNPRMQYDATDSDHNNLAVGKGSETTRREF